MNWLTPRERRALAAAQEAAAPVTVRPSVRARVLGWAANLTTTPGDPAAVAANASPLLQWLEQATSKTDLAARFSFIMTGDRP